NGTEEMKRPRGDMRACAVGDSPAGASFCAATSSHCLPIGKARAGAPRAKFSEFPMFLANGEFHSEIAFPFETRGAGGPHGAISRIRSHQPESPGRQFNATGSFLAMTRGKRSFLNAPHRHHEHRHRCHQ